jgi:dolichyl-diphosphooligosaccharide--protein glycosyltransferase
MVRSKIRRAYYPLALLGLGIAGLLTFYVIDPGLLGSMIRRFGIFTPSAIALTISEVQPLLFPQGNFSLATAWGNFTTGFFLSFIAIAVLIYTIVKNGNTEKSLLVIWSLLILAATLGQRRFAYYLAVNVALLTGYLSWQALQFIWLKTSVTGAEVKTIKRRKRKGKHKNIQTAGFRLTPRHLTMTLSILIVFFLVFYPNLKPSITTAKKASLAPSDAWYGALSWLNKNTPEPFGNPDAYYELHEAPQSGEDYDYPESAYGVMAWWDYGHMITRIGHRIPVSNPFQSGVGPAAKFFTAQQMITANEIMDSLSAKYIIIDHETADENIMTAMAMWADINPRDLFDIYYQLQDGKLWPVKLFHPEYYRSLSVRLYTFNGDEVIPENTDVISYQEKVNADGTYYKEIITWESFPTYEAASAYLLRQKTGDYRIVNREAYLSPVPLEALHNYKLVYISNEEVKQPGIGMVPAIKIFEYAK